MVVDAEDAEVILDPLLCGIQGIPAGTGSILRELPPYIGGSAECPGGIVLDNAVNNAIRHAPRAGPGPHQGRGGRMNLGHYHTLLGGEVLPGV